MDVEMQTEEAREEGGGGGGGGGGNGGGAPPHMGMDLVASSLNRHRAFAEAYRLTEKIGSGAFGSVYRGTHLKSGESVAVKLAYKVDKTSALMNEARLMIRLQRSVPLPRIRKYGHCAELHINYIVMERLGVCLSYENIVRILFADAADATVRSAILIHIFVQLLSIMRLLHEEGFVYRDVKPSNFMLGRPPKEKTVYMIDLGAVKCFRDAKSGKHAPMRSGVRPVGTPRYMSSNTHRGLEQSRRDDLESLGYLFHYMCTGCLPWDKETDHAAIAEMKDAFKRTGIVARGGDNHNANGEKKAPHNIFAYLRAVSEVEYSATPDYGNISAILSHAVLF